MKESLLQWIWQHQYFNTRDLRTTTGEEVQVLSPGRLNTDQGPDFFDSKVRIGCTCWVGAIELHVMASDWQRHSHGTDKNYQNVILHVVWVNDAAERDMPTLVLEGRVSKWLFHRYEQAVRPGDPIACQGLLPEIDKDIWLVWKQQLMEQRLYRRALSIDAHLAVNHQHWEETCWWLMARTFGGPVNGPAFEMMAGSLPISLLARQQGMDPRREALLMGQAGLLEGVFHDEYPGRLQLEFRYLRTKHRLPAIPAAVHFLRMRPDNFPTIRLAQLGALLAVCPFWFSRAKEAEDPSALKALMVVTTDPYWDKHYLPDRPSPERVKRLGEGIKDSLLINTFIPLLFAYGRRYDLPTYCKKAVRWLKSLNAEKNAVIDQWAGMDVRCMDAGDSQALLELRRQYCDPRHCLQCAIGKTLLGSGR
ncbi:MAG: DUF2851 family protein [Chitinophagaceae bacterium]|nr:DUF2851 family protein [Chitinophagaceae bacterium]